MPIDPDVEFLGQEFHPGHPAMPTLGTLEGGLGNTTGKLVPVVFKVSLNKSASRISTRRSEDRQKLNSRGSRPEYSPSNFTYYQERVMGGSLQIAQTLKLL